jgi:hypothetical protein
MLLLTVNASTAAAASVYVDDIRLEVTDAAPRRVWGFAEDFPFAASEAFSLRPADSAWPSEALAAARRLRATKDARPNSFQRASVPDAVMLFSSEQFYKFLPAYSESLNTAPLYSSEIPRFVRRMFAERPDEPLPTYRQPHPEMNPVLKVYRRSEDRRRSEEPRPYPALVSVRIHQQAGPLARNLAAEEGTSTPRVFVTRRVVRFRTPDEELVYLSRTLTAGASLHHEITTSDPRFRGGSPPNTAPEPIGEVGIRRDEPERVVLEVSARSPGYLALLDLWSPGWRATVDGRRATIYRGYVGARFIEIPAGRHTVEFRFTVPRLVLSSWLSALALGLAAVFIGADSARRVHAQRYEEAPFMAWVSRVAPVALRSRWFRFAILPAALATLLAWPLFLARYHIVGHAGIELLMAAGLKSRFNLALLEGMFPLWNEWVGGGTVFLLFGSALLHPYTLLELIFDRYVGDRMVAFEVAVSYALVAGLMMLACRWLGLRLWIGVAGFLGYVLSGPVTMIAHIPWWWSGLFVAGPTMLLIVSLYPGARPRRLEMWYLGLSLFLVNGVKPEAFYMFLIFLLLLVVGGAVRDRFEVADPASPRGLGPLGRLVWFVLLPLALYAWQAPLVASLLRFSTFRFFAVDETLRGGLENLYLSAVVSSALRTGLAAFLMVLAVRFGTRRAPVDSDGRPHRVWAFADWRSGLCVVGAVGLALSSWPGRALGVAWMAAIGWGILAGLARNLSTESVMREVSLLSAWRWPVLAAGMHSALFETQALSPVQPVPALCRGGFVFVVIVGALYRPEEGRGDETASHRRRSRVADYLIIGLGLGWLLRDFATLPLFDLFGFMWINPRDVFWYAPCPALLAMLGLLHVRELLSPGGALAVTSGWLGRARAGAHVVVTALLLVALVQALGFALLRFYVPAGYYVDNAVWQHATARQERVRASQIETYRRRYETAVQEEGGFVRGITDLNYVVGLAGAAARFGVRDASAWDLVGDSYRRLVERAYFLPETDLRDAWPRMWVYSVSADRVYQKRFPPRSVEDRWRDYGRTLGVPTGSRIDPFYFELLRVGIIWRFDQPPLPTDAQLVMFAGDPILTYRFRPRRSLQRFGILPGSGWSGRTLAPHGRQELKGIYDSMLFTVDELRREGIEMLELDLGANTQKFRIRTDREGYLVVFDTWHPDWRATVNGKRVEIVEALGAFRAIHLESGLNQIRLTYSPTGLGWGVAGSVAGLLLALLWLVAKRGSDARA